MRYIYALLFVAVLSPAILFAQFQAPTADELRMSSDPKAPGAAAVYLNLSETTDDPYHVYTFYARIKILKPAGEKLATVEIPAQLGDTGATSVKPGHIGRDWTSTLRAEQKSQPAGAREASQTIFKIKEIRGRTIHPDGTIVPLTVAAESLAGINAAGARGEPMTFTLPAAEPGSIFEYSYSIGYSDTHFSSPIWRVQGPYFVDEAHFAFTPFNDFLAGRQSMTSQYLVDANNNVVNTLIWWPILPPGVAVKTADSGRYTLDMTDVPPIPDEEWMPPAGYFANQVRFYYKNEFSGKEFWESEEKRWSKDVDRFAETTPSIVHAVGALTAAGDSPLDKAKKLYKAVQGLDNSDFASGTAPDRQSAPPAANAGEVLSRKGGTGREIARLYLALLRAAGVTAYDITVVNRDKGAFASGYLSTRQFDDDLVIAVIDGKEIFLDPSQEMCPFQTVHWKHAGASGIRQTAGGVSVATTPLLAYGANATLRLGDLTLDGQGNVTGTLRFILTGQEALNWRQQSLRYGADATKQAFDAWLQTIAPQGVQAHLDRFAGLDDPDLNLVAMAGVQGSLAAPASGHYAIPAFFFEVRSREPFIDAPQRQEPIDMHYGERVRDEVVYHLPSGYAIQSAPAADNIAIQPYAAFGTSAKVEAGQITMSRTLARTFTIAGASEYPNLRGFYQKVDAADREQIELHAGGVAAN
ncbi:MAG: DUF3857 domain-containing protein [Terracidiphilus sp.]|jgi:hypothetical protein